VALIKQAVVERRWIGHNACEKKRKSVQKNKVFIFIAVLHLGETGSLTKLNLSKGMTFTLQCTRYCKTQDTTTIIWLVLSNISSLRTTQFSLHFFNPAYSFISN
jgi:hypothetical protein